MIKVLVGAVRSNVVTGGIAISDLNPTPSEAVLYVEQDLIATQMNQARRNISAADASIASYVGEGVVQYIYQLKNASDVVFFPQTIEKAVIDSHGVDLETKLASLIDRTYTVAWDGTSAPVVEDIPAGVSVVYESNTYVGTLPASASTVDNIYLVSDGAGNYARYISQQNGSAYSWEPLGSTAIDLSDYQRKDDEVWLTQEEFDALAVKDPTKTYNVYEEVTSL